MSTYTVDAKELEGVILSFKARPDTSFLVFHHTLNSVYGVDLNATDFNFLFDDVPTNDLIELYNDVPKRLLDYMIQHIKTESELVGTRSKTDQVEKLFKTTQLRYQMNTEKCMYF